MAQHKPQSLKDLKDTDRSGARRLIRAHAKKIRDGFVKRVEDKTTRRLPIDTPRGYLKHRAYRLTRYIIKAEKLETLADVAYTSENPGSVSVYDNPFHWTLAGILPNVLLDNNDHYMDRQSRNRMSKELLYAHRHDVHHKYVVGFIYQSGGWKAFHEKLATGGVEKYSRKYEDKSSKKRKP